MKRFLDFIKEIIFFKGRFCSKPVGYRIMGLMFWWLVGLTIVWIVGSLK